MITLNNGHSCEISFERFDSMSDSEWKTFMDSEYGEEVNDPFYHSQIDTGNRGNSSSDDDILEDE